MVNNSFWTPYLIAAGKKAYKELSKIYGSEFACQPISQGAGGDITAKIDQIAEDIIIKELEKIGKPFVMISEEIGIYNWDGQKRTFIQDLRQISLSEYPSSYIILDPVDGSSNAIRGIPFSCVSIAVAKEPRISQIEVGVLISLQTGDEYVAEKGKGSFLNGKPLHCSSISDISQAFMGTDLDSSEKCKELIVENENLFRAVSKRRILGSCALELGFIANGNMDLYFDVRGVLRIIDFAAGLLILSEAGGFLLDATGAPLSDQIFTLQTGFDLIAGCPGLLPIMKDLLHHNPIIYDKKNEMEKI
ncbi:MAG: hypothetical protein DRO88_05600 [Promethearchaeia archaeon]|nr:MAG: hypothetical protein DRO88_05600 [Candidatus Lokiarchaeia archaeon]